MPVREVRTLKPTSNEILLDRIRDDASPAYQARIPEATKAGVQSTMKAIQTYRPQQNEFIDALVNKIALTIIQGTSWTNPMSEFKRGLLTGGDTIEEINVGLIKAKTYDPARDELERELFGTAPIEVQNSFHKVNRRDRYKVTINQPLLMSAFNTPMGLSSFAAQIMSAPGTSDQWDEFLLMCSLFSEYESNGGYFKVKIRDITTNEDSATLEADSKSVLTKLREMAGTLKFISTQYNASRMPISAQPDDLILFVTPRFNAVLDVEALAGAFNVEKMSLSGRVIEIPEENFGISGAQALMTTKDFFVVADQLFETASQWNPASLQNNYWLHRWQVISASRYVPAILFTTEDGDEIVKVITPVTSVEAITITDINGDTPATVARGDVYSLDTAAVTDPADGINDGVRWTLYGNTSPRTYVSQTGVIHIGGDEGATTLTVRATSTWLNADNLMIDGEYAEIVLTVSGLAVLDAWPNVDNPDTAGDDTTNQVTGIEVKGVAVAPAFEFDTYTYTVTVPGGTAEKADFDVFGPDAGDVKIAKAGAVFTITVASAAGDPVYTVTVS
jgi:hypothetical protein